MTAMLFLINLCFFFGVLSLSLIRCSTGINFRDLKFAYRKEVPYYDGNETLFSTTSRSFIASYGRCAVQCIEDLSCNALELCSVSGVSECRATTGLMKSGSQTNRTEMCKQYAMDFSCGDDAFSDRRQGLCIFDDCSDCDCVRQYKTISGGYGLNIDGKLVFVLCEFEPNQTWTVIQNRHNGSVDFGRTWPEYTNGFGFVLTEYWIGTEYIHRLTLSGLTTVRIDLEDYDGNKRYAEYSFFNVSDGNDHYRLTVSGYSGTAGDSMSSIVGDEKADGEMFSTTDKDNDRANSNCAAQGRGGWWYGKCTFSSLNGEYDNNSKFKGINWQTFKGMSYSLKASKMKLRRL
ncbi:ficolin-2-like [Crassostrea angulata]|uniref:ficolin-2-like n=1 Tax=Magallana angulata TaxID=2784310 RepID=UPI0022B10654|nr:ficolin-2-like [Crassostrea angulata]